MTQQLKFGDIVLHKETGQKGSVIDFKFGVVVALHGDTHIDTFDYNEIELIPHPDTSRLDWMIMREHADDLRAEDKVFVLQTYRENIDIRIRLAAKLAAEAV